MLEQIYSKHFGSFENRECKRLLDQSCHEPRPPKVLHDNFLCCEKAASLGIPVSKAMIGTGKSRRQSLRQNLKFP